MKTGNQIFIFFSGANYGWLNVLKYDGNEYFLHLQINICMALANVSIQL